MFGNRQQVTGKATPLQARLWAKRKNHIATRTAHMPQRDGGPHDVSLAGISKSNMRPNSGEICVGLRADFGQWCGTPSIDEVANGARGRIGSIVPAGKRTHKSGITQGGF